MAPLNQQTGTLNETICVVIGTMTQHVTPPHHVQHFYVKHPVFSAISNVCKQNRMVENEATLKMKHSHGVTQIMADVAIFP